MSDSRLGIVLVATGVMLFVQPVSAKLKKDMSLEQAREEVRRAGWRLPEKPYCHHDNSDNSYDGCSGTNFPNGFFKSFPEFYWMPSDLSIAGACYEGDAERSLEVVFVYDEKTLHSPVSEQRDFSSFFARLRLESWRLTKGKCGNDS